MSAQQQRHGGCPHIPVLHQDRRIHSPLARRLRRRHIIATSDQRLGVWKLQLHSWKICLLQYVCNITRLITSMSAIYDFEGQRTSLTNIRHRLSVIELGGPASHVYFVQHGNYAAQAQKLLGKEVVDKEYPMDHTHTAPFLADVVRSCNSSRSSPLCSRFPEHLSSLTAFCFVFEGVFD